MLTREQIQELLQPITDTESGKSLVELQLIRDIMIKEDRISLSIICLSTDEQKRIELEQQVRELLEAGGAGNVHIRLRDATDHERFLVRGESGREESDAGSSQEKLKGHAAGLESYELINENSGVHFVAVASGKGGVGKSTVTVNLAVALSRMGKKVGLIDADIYGFSIPDMMGIEEGPIVEEGTIIPVERFGVKVMSMGFFIRENSPVIWRGPMLGKMLRQFFSDVGWGELDYMLLDLPPGTGDVALDVHQMLPQSKEIIVTTPHATAAFVAARAGSMALQTDHEIVGVIENMSYYECSACGQKDYVFGRGGGAKLAETLHTELLAQIPLGAPDNHISEPGFSPSVYKAETPTAQRFADIASKLISKCEKK
ncbi:Mrp/NBP35 family ATP-binding protein [Paenibacillus sp. BR2-3]|uniref:Mrp/NBP35 family ATP-binding protein n=1 Tax=Paenibacillus sp. BR2-3 TaxID=3048494 RepID=UPI0039779D81